MDQLSVVNNIDVVELDILRVTKDTPSSKARIVPVVHKAY